MTKEARFRTSGLGVVALMMLLSYQNCGQAATSGSANLPTDGSVHIAPSKQDATETVILTQVLNSYSVCNQISDSASRITCERNALQSNSMVTAPVVAAAGQVKSANAVVAPLVCYVVGPKCLVPDSDGSYNSLMRLQLCRTNMINQQGYNYDSLNQYMQNDPIGYAQDVNSNCLYRDSQCVVAVRCVDPQNLSTTNAAAIDTGSALIQ